MRRPNLVLACANSKIQSLYLTWNMGVCPPVTYIRSGLSRQARTGLANLWHAYTQRHVERFPSQAAFTAVPDQPVYTVKNICLCIHQPDCAETVYELPLLPNKTVVKHFYTNRERWGVLSGYLLLGRRSDGDRANTICDIGQNVLQSSF
jgi:hypothetical protein